MRFPLEVVQAVRAAIPHRMPLGARITGNDWVEGGLTPADAAHSPKPSRESEWISFAFLRAVSAAGARPAMVPNMNVDFAEEVKRKTGIPTRAVGLIATPKRAEAIVAEGKADMVALARAMLDNPHWGWHAGKVLGAEIARPKQYQRAAPNVWAGATFQD